MECKLSIFLVFTFIGITLFGQEIDYDKELNALTKYQKLFYKKAPKYYDKAIKKTRNYIDKNEQSSVTAYEVLVEMEYVKYHYYANFFGNQKGITKNEDGGSKLNVMQRYYFYNLINTCRISTIESTSYTADMLLRTILIEKNPDTLVNQTAQSFFNTAEELFEKEEYQLAAMHYRKALKADPNFYQASLYLGDSYWAMKELDSAVVYFNQTKNQFPSTIEPRLFLINALMDNGLFYRARKESIEAISYYPGQDVKLKLQEVLRQENKYMNEHRFIRGFFPNDMVAVEQDMLSNVPFWSDYRKAKLEVESFCNDEGIIENNAKVKDQYLEVYSFRRMLEENQDNLPPYLKFADEMRKKGFLEPYVLVSMYHIDFFPQLQHYVLKKENRAKIIEYIETFLIEPLS
jgi:tetratricopeptide (TPR) repeat protein